jgi:hypothetical protein
VKAGLSAARHHGDARAPDHRMGLGSGVEASIFITSAFSVQPELLYIMKGGVIPRVELIDAGGSTIGFQSMTYAVDYLEIPVLACISVPADGRASPYFLAGPSMAFKISERIKGDPTEEPDRRDDLVTTDVGLAFGAGLELGLGRGRWVLEGRYTAGLINALAPAGASVRNGAFLVTAGLVWHR